MDKTYIYLKIKLQNGQLKQLLKHFIYIYVKIKEHFSTLVILILTKY